MRKIFSGTTKATKIMVIALLSIVMFGTVANASVSQNGTDVKFTKFDIKAYNSNTAFTYFTKLTFGRKRMGGEELYVTVTNMYDENGKNMDNEWTYTRWRVDHMKDGDTVVLANDVKLKRGVYSKISLDKKATTGDTLRISARGNSSKYKAKISGYIHDFTQLF